MKDVWQFNNNCQFDKPAQAGFLLANNCLFANRHHTRYGRFKRPVNCGQFDHGRQIAYYAALQHKRSLSCASGGASVKGNFTACEYAARQWACQVQKSRFEMFFENLYNRFFKQGSK